ncbi:caspase activity and apoptosis inhibitor 1 [Biomphalaria glabrata]|nr:caspase activity and apoptosis inhibitor 1 [Biomphalaria glabrata]
MSAAKMVADSTQSELADTLDGKKKKKKIKKASKKVLLPEDEDSDLDLKKDLKPIVTFVKDRPAMIREMFRAVRGASLQRALPDLLKVGDWIDSSHHSKTLGSVSLYGYL